jgi:hypothetical protein
VEYEVLSVGEKKPKARCNSSCCVVGDEIYMFGGGNGE